jgi:hypothetical protein
MVQLQTPYQLLGTFTQKKDAPPQRGEWARGLSGWLSKGQKQSRCLASGHSKSHAYRCLANRFGWASSGSCGKVENSMMRPITCSKSGDIAAGKDCP